jgi:dTDP-L-rhamnose 4-epimerase
MTKKYKKILVTGGAGFIGSHLIDGLIKKGYLVRVMDNLYEQIHPDKTVPKYLNKKAQFFKGDVTNKNDWLNAIKDVDAVFHFAAAVGVGQSMYEIEHYVKVNSLGTAIFLDILANKKHHVKKVIVAASMSSYGEGVYKCKKCGIVRPGLRKNDQLVINDWNVHCPVCDNYVDSIPTPETAQQYPNSIYAIGKKDQEDMVLNIGAAYNIPSVAMRYFNVYGTRQSLSNPYNGVAAIFMSRIKNNKPPVINEDGLQTRDFVHVSDVTKANIMALESDNANNQIFNVGSGKPITIRKVAEILLKLYKSNLKIELSGRIRKLDVRHCYADITKIKKLLGWYPQVSFENGLKELIKWSKNEQAQDKVEFAMRELEKRGLR